MLPAIMAKVSPRLNEVEAKPVGSGHLDFGLRGSGGLNRGFVGAGVSAEWRPAKNHSFFADIEGGVAFDPTGTRAQWQALAGWRWRF